MSSEPLKLLAHSFDLSNNKKRIHVRVEPPVEGERQPCNVICILDISGSMSSAAEELSGAENSGFSRLDLVKHSVRTIIELMNERDHISIVSFSDTARVELAMTLMDVAGKKSAISKLEGIQTEGSTNVWDGLKVALEMSEKITDHVNCLLFTDGEPNVFPPNGIIPTLEQHVAKHGLNSTLHTYGFGYSVDTGLLVDISRIGSGLFSYIPDCSMVGTSFVNTMSNILSTLIGRVDLNFKAINGAKIERVYGISQNGPVTDLQNVTLALGGAQIGQTKDFIIDVTNNTSNSSLEVTVSFKEGKKKHNIKVNDVPASEDLKNEMNVQFCRMSFIDEVQKCSELANQGHLNRCDPILKNLVKLIEQSPSSQDERCKALVKDIESTDANEGQVSKAVSQSNWFNKWGKHYLPSLTRANFLQTCHNFKDPSVQLYGGKLFKDLQTIADDLFCQLPPPKPSNVYDSNYTPVSNMSSYYNAGGSCFDGNSRILMADDSTKMVKDIKKGDKVKGMSDGFSSTILCVLKSKTPSDKVQLCEMNGMLITPYHPVRVGGEWKFPIQITAPQEVECDYVYNLVIDQGHVVSINGVECITLGHGFTNNAVLNHPYYGTTKIVDDLKKMKGFNNGYIVMDKYTFTRDSTTGMISSVTLVE